MRQIAIGDIHGCSKTLLALLDKLGLENDDELYFIGDYINKGPDTKGVIDAIYRLKTENIKTHLLMGNHEALLIDALHEPKHEKAFLARGGKTTLKSFGIKNLKKLPEHYVDFFHSLEFYWETDRYFLVHAGFDFSSKDPFSNHEAMLWRRRTEVNDHYLKGKNIIHGHSPVPKAQIKKSLGNRIINIDAGCVFHKYAGLGRLCAFDMSNEKFIFKKYREM